MKNAIERGSDINKAKQSLINAGYSPQEIEIASKNLEKEGIPKNLRIPETKKLPVNTTAPLIKKKKKFNKWMIIFGILILLIIIFAGLLVFFRNG